MKVHAILIVVCCAGELSTISSQVLRNICDSSSSSQQLTMVLFKAYEAKN